MKRIATNPPSTTPMKRITKLLIVCATVCSGILSARAADEIQTKQIRFEAGRSEAIVSGKVTGHGTILYKLVAKNGQYLTVQMLPDSKADFNIYIPGRGPGDEALFTSDTGGRSYLGQLYKNGEHGITVFQNRAAARRGETAPYKMLVRITDKAPNTAEEVPATGPVPQKVKDDCLGVLRQQLTPGKSMKVIRAVRGENSFIIDVEVEGVPKPWRCFHDGTKVTGTEYQGEG